MRTTLIPPKTKTGTPASTTVMSKAPPARQGSRRPRHGWQAECADRPPRGPGRAFHSEQEWYFKFLPQPLAAQGSGASVRNTDVSSCRGVRRGGPIDMRAQAEMPSALRPDTPASVRGIGYGAEDASLASSSVHPATGVWRWPAEPPARKEPKRKGRWTAPSWPTDRSESAPTHQPQCRQLCLLRLDLNQPVVLLQD